MNMPDVATIVLCAGRSSRLGMHKALLPIDNSSAVTRVARCSLASRSNRSVVVLGSCADSIRVELAGLPIEIVENPDYEKGRTGSIKCALRYLAESLANMAVIIFPVDCPFITESLLNRLIDCYYSQKKHSFDSLWIVPDFMGKRGHPVLLAGPILFRILELDDDFPLSAFLNKSKLDRLLRYIALPVESETVLDNINCRDDVFRLFKREGIVCQALP